MTDLVSLIKAAIETAPHRQMNGRIDYQSMAEAAAKVVAEKTIQHLEGVASNYLDTAEKHLAAGVRATDANTARFAGKMAAYGEVRAAYILEAAESVRALYGS